MCYTLLLPHSVIVAKFNHKVSTNGSLFSIKCTLKWFYFYEHLFQGQEWEGRNGKKESTFISGGAACKKKSRGGGPEQSEIFDVFACIVIRELVPKLFLSSGYKYTYTNKLYIKCTSGKVTLSWLNLLNRFC